MHFTSHTLKDLYRHVVVTCNALSTRQASQEFCGTVMDSVIKIGSAAQAWAVQKSPEFKPAGMGSACTAHVSTQGLCVVLAVRTYAGYENKDPLEAPSHLVCNIELYQEPSLERRISMFGVENNDWSESFLKQGCLKLVADLSVQFSH